MAGKPSAIGFGFQSFGEFPFGHADWAEEVTYSLAPQAHRDLDVRLEGETTVPFRKLCDSYKPQLQDLLDRWDLFPTLWDANRVPIDQLDQLGYNFDVFPSTIKDEALRRAEVLNAIQFFISKGLDRGYEIAGAFSGLVVTIRPQWVDENGDLTEDGPDEFVPSFESFPADSIALDATFSSFYAKWPGRLTWDRPYRSAALELFFSTPDNTEIQNFSVVAEDVVKNVERVRPIHVRISRYRFDGPSVVAGGWTMAVNAEGTSTGGGWSVPVVGELRSSSVWTIPVVATPAP